MDGTTRGGAGAKPPANVAGSKLYQTIMTPLNFVTFIISLWIVSGRNQRKRVAMHPRRPSHNGVAAWLPSWLQGVIFRPQPYHYIDDRSDNPPNYMDKRFYYHSKQRKIMKLEAADAFELRSSVLGALCIAGVALVWVCVCLGRALLTLTPWQQVWTA
ncbi:uncharacterized protein B0I36DRAFT_317578 [Microdochium trichocladiopsis]|uniref:Uncharacterized protein n=1 Tax=Microdochium trichocladiopsis TaxID=1682393 RepID=A0A9P9BQP1_9PEZI|nr:uncharacterized protein B0I36DRAFT_317578 [Microdochium trichocladiopsis]KAH7035083.1 hypothetical protein B0I36DRAFT_317578 [Microdochium trichocladiopsis]